VKQFQGGLVFKANRLFVSLNSRSRVIKKKKKKAGGGVGAIEVGGWGGLEVRVQEVIWCERYGVGPRFWVPGSRADGLGSRV
jgi:hypothetical protein